MEFFYFIVAILILFFLFNLNNRVKKLEYNLKQNKNNQNKEILSRQEQEKTIKFDNSVISNNTSNINYKEIDSGPNAFEKFTLWVKEDWLLKLGALLLLIGFGWLTTYAFLNNWIGPMGRIALGIIAGSLIIVLGWWRIKNYINQGGVFLVLGSTVILLTIFAAREIYHFFSPFSALSVMFLSTAFVALASVKYNSRSLALSSLILAGIAPLLTNSPVTDYTGLFLYLLIVTLGTVWIVVLTGRRELSLAALILISFYSFPQLINGHPTIYTEILLPFAYAFSAVFFLTNTVGILKLKNKNLIPDLITAAGNGLFLLTWIMVAAPDDWKSLIITSWMLVFVVGAYLLFKITQRHIPFYVYAGIGIVMLGAATSAELHGATLTIAFTIECAIVSIITYLILNDIKKSLQMNLLFIIPILLSLESMGSPSWRMEGFLNKDFFVLSTLSLSLLILGLFFYTKIKNIEDNLIKKLNTSTIILGTIYVYILIWLSLEASIKNNDLAVLISLIIYTIIGLIVYFRGFLNDKKIFQKYGGVMLGFVILRLLLIDIWRMELSGRIITFFLIGALLVSTAFLSKYKKEAGKPTLRQ